MQTRAAHSVLLLTGLCLILAASANLACFNLASPVHADFTGAPRTGPSALIVQFDAQAAVDPPLELEDAAKFRDPGVPPAAGRPQPVRVVRWLWNFGDGTTGAGPNPTHTYVPVGCYDVTLTAFFSNGMVAVERKPDYICVTAAPNNPPVADAGPDQNVNVGALVRLDGWRSSDPDGDPLTYQWSLTGVPAGSNAMLAATAARQTSFTADLAGDYTVQLIVDDGRDAKVASAPDTAVITAGVPVNNPPVAVAVGPAVLVVGRTVQVDGSQSSDPDGDPLDFAWAFAALPPGSNATLDDPNAVAPSFLADVPGDYVLILTVSDGELNSTDYTLTITVTNYPPVADAGPDQAVEAGTQVQLDGSASYDDDGDPLTYAWTFLSMPQGSQTTLDDPARVAPAFTPHVVGVYELQLIVDDGRDTKVASDPDTVVVTVNPGPNRPPVADAGADQNVLIGAQVQLDGAASYDPDGDPLTYAWSLVAQPQGSTASLANATMATAGLTPDVAGDYVAQLIVDDGKPAKVASSPDTVTITAAPGANNPPVADAGDDQWTATWTRVVLDGTDSYDPDGDAITYAWTFVSQPGNSDVELSANDAPEPHFIAQVPGEYILQLVVDDGHPEGKAASSPDEVSIICNEYVPEIQCIIPPSDFVQGATQFEIDNALAYDNETPSFWADLDAYNVGVYEITNEEYCWVLNYALNQGHLDAYVDDQVFPYEGGDVVYRGETLIQIEGGPDAGEYCDIEFDAENHRFYVADRNLMKAGGMTENASDLPVVEVSWYGAVAYCDWLNELLDLEQSYHSQTWEPLGYSLGFRLCMDSEWEYAAAWEDQGEGGKHWIYAFQSDDISADRCNYSEINPLGLADPPYVTHVGYYNGLNAGTTDSYSPAGCYDMSGNVWEWVEDVPYEYTTSAKVDPGLGEAIVRGGSYLEDARDQRTARRNFDYWRNETLENIGFRVALYSDDCSEYYYEKNDD